MQGKNSLLNKVILPCILWYVNKQGEVCMKKTVGKPNYLTISDLMERWKCKYTFANAFMHRKNSGAIKIGRKLLITEKEVINYESTCGIATGY